MIKTYSVNNVDCLRACISSIVENDLIDFPNLHNFKYWFNELTKYLYKKGYDTSYRKTLDTSNDIKYCIAVYKNPWELTQYHSVVYSNNKIVHNPSINDDFDYDTLQIEYFIIITKINNKNE